MPKFKHGTHVRLLYQVALTDAGSILDFDADAGREFIVVMPYDPWMTDEVIIYMVETDEWSDEGSFTSQDAIILRDPDALEVIGQW